MTAHNCLYLIAMVLAVMGWETLVYAEGDVTIISTPATTNAPPQKTVAPDGTPVVHIHKKKTATTATASADSGPSTPMSPVASVSSATADNKPVRKQAMTDIVTTAHPPSAVASTTAQAQPIASTITVSAKSAPVLNSVPSVPGAPVPPAASVPTVETGLPVARYPGMGTPIKGVSTYVPTTVPLPAGKSVAGATTHQPYFASALPSSVVPLTSSAAGSFSSPSRTTSPSPDFVFTNYSKKAKTTYPWKTGIITTMFWIGEGGSNISSTDNKASSWDEKWISTNRGTDNPNDRNGYATAGHASTVNPFYVALPFNDLAFPDKAHEWVPRSWHRPPQDGKQVSACKDRWVWIKNAQGRSCFAQWEDVGPLRYDHAEYVFGDERPDTYTRAGLDVSPAVAQYLGIDGNSRAITSWRFVDDEDVPPGAWLKYDEQAVIYTALHQLRSTRSSSDLPIQRATEPMDDPSNIDSNKKKVDASKG